MLTKEMKTDLNRWILENKWEYQLCHKLIRRTYDYDMEKREFENYVDELRRARYGI